MGGQVIISKCKVGHQIYWRGSDGTSTMGPDTITGFYAEGLEADGSPGQGCLITPTVANGETARVAWVQILSRKDALGDTVRFQ